MAVREGRTRRLAARLRGAALILGAGGLVFVGAAVAAQQSAAQPPLQRSSPALSMSTGGDQGWQLHRVPQLPIMDRPPPHVAPTETAASLPPSKPAALVIPAIGVQSPIHALGLDDDGALETPEPGPRYNHAAWYRHSPTPGAMGPAILLGHVDSATEGPSVFFRLGELTPGDRVLVTRDDDSVAVFRVDHVRRYAKADFPTNLVYRDIDHAGLRLVTCGGAFDSASGHYLDNIVVFASLMRSP
jgi:hypothetical protein